MKVKIGDLINDASMFRYIAQGCNCFCVMGAGIAYDIKTKLHGAYEADLNTEKGDFDKLGDYSFATVQWNGADTKFTTVFNIYTQYGFHGPKPLVVYPALELGLLKLAHFVREEMLEHPTLNHSIGIPLIGYGLAGGNLDIIIDIILRTLDDLDVTIYVYDQDPNRDSLAKYIAEKIYQKDDNVQSLP